MENSRAHYGRFPPVAATGSPPLNTDCNFQWNVHRGKQPLPMMLPPSLPALPPWAQHQSLHRPLQQQPSQPPPLSSFSSREELDPLQQQPSQPMDAGWKRPMSFFGSLKRLPIHSTPLNDPISHPQHNQRPEVEEAEEEEELPQVSHVSQLPSLVAEASNQPEDAVVPPTTSFSPSVPTPLVRQWKKKLDDTDGGDNNNNEEPTTPVNKWKSRALINPFAKKKMVSKHSEPQLPSPHEEEPAQAEEEEEEEEKPRAPLPPARMLQNPTKSPLRPSTPPPPIDLSTKRPVHLVGKLSKTKHSVSEESLDRSPSKKSQKQLEPLAPLAPLAARASENNDTDDEWMHRVKPKPIKQQLKAAKPKQPKLSTLDALTEIQRKREARRNQQAEDKQRMKDELQQHGDDAGYKFRRLIQKFRDALPPSQQTAQKPQSLPPLPSASVDPPKLSVFIRKRPLAKKELKAKGYDIITCLFGRNQPTRAFRKELICHEPKLKVDCSEALENHQFQFDGVFDEFQDNPQVYATTVGPLLPFVVSSTSSTSLTVFAYGQTGSGKTYTMKSIYRQAATDLFERLASRANIEVGVSFYEIYMNNVNDLLHGRKRVQLMEDGDGTVQLVGLKEVTIASAEELLELVQQGEDARATSANAVHDDSSRSHALLRVTLYDTQPKKAANAVLARLSMVDLAGSERACDTQSDSKNTRMEGAEINKSLLALKECIRALDRGATHIPFRQSKLTQLLRDSFLCAQSRTVMIATISPWSESCNHTLNTLRYADRLKEIGSS